MNARVRGAVGSEIVFPSLPIRSIERIRFALSYPHPDRAKAIRLRLPTEGLPIRFECMSERPDGSIAVPRGAVELVRTALAADDLGVDYADERTVGEPIAIPRRPDLRSYQTVGVNRLADRAQGLIVIPCGGGKSLLCVGAIARLARTALVLVHTDDLLDQWAADVRDHLGIQPGIVNADYKQIDAPVVIGSVFTVAAMLEETPTLGRRFGFVGIDECQHVPMKTAQRALRLLPARYRLGLTATPDREDGHGKLVDWSFGARLLVKTVQELVAGGFLMMPRVEVAPSAFEFEMDATDRRRLTKLHRALVADEARNRLIVERAYWAVQAGQTVLILSNRKPHCRRLGKMLEALSVDARVVIGTTNKTDRKGALEDLRSGTTSVVIATSLANEGLNIKRLSRIILAFPDRSIGWTVQRIGRLTRVWEGKDPALIDVVDPKVETLVRRAADRRRAFRSIGIDV